MFCSLLMLWIELMRLFFSFFTPGAAHLPSCPAHQWWPIHRKPRDSGHIEPVDCLVPLQPPGLPDRREPTPPRGRGRTGPRVLPRGPIRQNRPTEEHRNCRASWVSSSCRPCCDPEHLLNHIWDFFIQGRGAIDCTFTNTDWEEEGAWSAADCRGVGQVHWWVLLWWDFWCHLGLFLALCHQPSLLC